MYIYLFSFLIIIFSIAITALAFPKKFRRKRFLLGVVFLLIAVCSLWVLRGGSITISRQILMIRSLSLSSPQQQQIMKSYKYANSSLQQLILQNTDVSKKNLHYFLPEKPSFDNVFEKAIEIIDSFSQPWHHFFHRNTILIVLDNSTIWKTLRFSALEKIHQSLQQKNIDLFIINTSDENYQGRLRIAIPEENTIYQTSHIHNLTQQVYVSLEGCHYPQSSDEYIKISLDDGKKHTFFYQNGRNKPVKNRQTQFALGNFQGEDLQCGWHSLKVEYYGKGDRALKSDTDVKYNEGYCYFYVARKKVLVVANSQLDWWTKRTWKITEQKFKPFFTNIMQEMMGNVDVMDPISKQREQHNVHFKKRPGYSQRVRNLWHAINFCNYENITLEYYDALVLVKPTCEQLQSLEATLTPRIEQGLQVLIIHPPHIANSTQKSWLRNMAQSFGDTLTAKRHWRKPQVYLFPDNSRLASFLLSGSKRDILMWQCEILNKISTVFSPNSPRIFSVKKDRISTNCQLIYGEFSRKNKQERDEIDIIPVSSPYIKYKNLTKGYPDFDGPLQSAITSSLQLRLGILKKQDSNPALPEACAIQEGVMYSNTAIVMFVPELFIGNASITHEIDKNTISKMIAKGKMFCENNKVVLPQYSKLNSLIQRGIQIHLICYTLPPSTQKFYKQKLSKLSVPINLKNKNIHLYSLDHHSPDIPEITRRILEKINKNIRLANIKVKSPQRVFDSRTRERRAPYFTTQMNKLSTFNKPLAVIDNSDPAVMSFAYGQGQVIYMNYCPLDLDMWKNDAGFIGENKKDGWGVQRFLDLMQLQSGVSLTPFPLLYGIELTNNKSLLRMKCWTKNLHDKIFVPKIDGRECRLYSYSGNTITFEFTSPYKMNGFYQIDFATKSVEDPRAHPKVFLDLSHESKLQSTNTNTTLKKLATALRGQILSNPQQFHFHKSLAWIVGLALCGLLLMLFTPLVKPWTALYITICQLRKQRQYYKAVDRDVSVAANVTTQLEIGSILGESDSKRKPGEFSHLSSYYTGDSLSLSVRSTLFAFTTAGQDMDLPPKLPLIRHKNVSRSLDVVVLIDISPSIHSPGTSNTCTKKQMLQAIVQIIAVFVGKTSGTLTIIPLQNSTRVWGPNYMPDELEVEKFICAQLESDCCSGNLNILQDHKRPGQIVYFISDLLGIATSQIHKIVNCYHDEVQFKVLHIVDTQEQEYVGNCYNITTKSYHDRSEWSVEDLQLIYCEYVSEIRASLQKCEQSSFTSLPTHLPFRQIVTSIINDLEK